MKKEQRSKYKNRRTTVDGITFDSQKEADYYLKFKAMLNAGALRGLECQPKFELVPKFQKNGELYRAVNYYADFLLTYPDGRLEVIDVKPSSDFQTAVYKLKRKLFEYHYPMLTITEVY